jgi:hypothetical protein
MLARYRLLRRCHRWRLSLFLCLCFDILFLRHFLTPPKTSSFRQDGTARTCSAGQQS